MIDNEEPIEYQEGCMEFLGCKIDLSKRPLIPRPEPEFWTRFAIDRIKDAGKKNLSILDMFSGSGCIGIAAACHLPDSRVDFGDIDPAAVEQIKINLKLNGIDTKRTNVFLSDIFENFPVGKKYDIILANPPYIDPARIKEVQSSVLNYEPHVALFGGKGGTEVIARFLQQAKGYLNPGATIYMEFDPGQKTGINDLLEKFGYSNCEFHKDQYGRIRFLVASK